MRRHLLLRGVDRRLIKRLHDCAAPIGLSAGGLVRAMLIEQLGKGATPAKRVKRRKPFKA